MTFPDFTYGVTQGDTLEQAREMAHDLFYCYFIAYGDCFHLMTSWCRASQFPNVFVKMIGSLA